jgi:hypothetical protein
LGLRGSCGAVGLSLRHPGQPHALKPAVAPSKEGRVVAPRTGNITIAACGETRIERKPRFHGSMGLVQLPEPRQRTRELEMRGGIISVFVEAPAKPYDCFGIGIELHFGEADPSYPAIGKGVARGEAQSLADVSFGFCPSTKKIFCVPDVTMSGG